MAVFNFDPRSISGTTGCAPFDAVEVPTEAHDADDSWQIGDRSSWTASFSKDLEPIARGSFPNQAGCKKGKTAAEIVGSVGWRWGEVADLTIA